VDSATGATARYLFGVLWVSIVGGRGVTKECPLGVRERCHAGGSGGLRFGRNGGKARTRFDEVTGFEQFVVPGWRAQSIILDGCCPALEVEGAELVIRN